MRSWLVALSIVSACHPGTGKKALPPESPPVAADYATTAVITVAVSHAPIRDALAGAALALPSTMGEIVIDARLSEAAARLGTTHRGQRGSRVGVGMVVRDVGSPHLPGIAVSVRAGDADLAGWATQTIASLEGAGPIALGIAGPFEGDEHVVVLSRKLIDLVDVVPRDDATRIHFRMHASLAALTPAAMIVGATGIERIAAVSLGDGAWEVSRPTGFDGTLIALVGETAVVDLGGRNNSSSEPLAMLELSEATAALHVDGDSLGDRLAAMRARWNLPALAIDEAEGPPCTELVKTIAGRPVTLDQHCSRWPAGGTDAERWDALRVFPHPWAAIAMGDRDLVQWRREPGWTQLRIARAFDDRTSEQAYAQLAAAITERWPGIAHAAGDDAGPRAIAAQWAKTPWSPAANAQVAAHSAEEASRWSKQPRYFRVSWNGQDLPELLAALAPDVEPTAYAMGVDRGTGAHGEPRYFVVVYLAIGPAPR